MKVRIAALVVIAVALGVIAFFMYREPADEKAARLRNEMEVACLLVKYTPVPTDEQQAKCDVATRRFNKFMGN